MKSRNLSIYRSYEGNGGETRRIVRMENGKVRFQRLGFKNALHFELPAAQFARWAKKEVKS